MTCAWALEAAQEQYTTCHGRVSKGTTKASSTQAGKGGRAVLLTKVKEVIEIHAIHTGKITICIDNLNAIVHRSTVQVGDRPFLSSTGRLQYQKYCPQQGEPPAQ